MSTNNNTGSNQPVRITVTRKKGGTVKNITVKPKSTPEIKNDVSAPEVDANVAATVDEPMMIGMRRHAEPAASKSETTSSDTVSAEKTDVVTEDYNDGFDDEYYEYEDPIPAVPIAKAASDVDPNASSSASEMLRNINISTAVDGAGNAMLAVPVGFAGTAKAIGSGIVSYLKIAPTAISEYVSAIPSLVKGFFTRHDPVRWAKTRTPMQWVKAGAAVLGFVVVIALCVVLVFMDSMLDKINYVAADHYGYISQSEADAWISMMESDSDVSLSDLSSNSDLNEEDIAVLELTLDQFTEDMFDIDKDDVVNILLLGTDTRSGKYVRDNSDSMILMSLDTKRNTIKLTSFMRDSYVTIPGYGKYRLNAAFAFGGADLLFKTLKKNFDVDVDKYVRVNFQAFKKVVDAVGGIEMYVTKAEAKYMCSHKTYGRFPRYKAGAGTYIMSGSEALNYARCRKVDSDFGRTDRQRKVLIAIADKLKGSDVSTIYDLMNEVLPLVETNLTKDEIYALIPPALGSISKEIETLNIPCKGSWKNYNANGAAVISLDFKVNKKAIRAHIYSTTKLDIEEKVWQNSYFETGSGSTTTTTTKPSDTTSDTSSDTSSTESTAPTNPTPSTEPSSTPSSSSTNSTASSTQPSESTNSTEPTSSSTETPPSAESTTSTSTTTTTTTTTTTKSTTTTTKATEAPPPPPPAPPAEEGSEG